eukprot:93562_1
MNTVISCGSQEYDVCRAQYIETPFRSAHPAHCIYNGYRSCNDSNRMANYPVSHSNSQSNPRDTDAKYDAGSSNTTDTIALPLYQMRQNKMQSVLHQYETRPLHLVTGFVREIGIESMDQIIIPHDLILLCFKFYQHSDIAKLIDSKDSDELYTISWEATENEDYLFAEQLIGYLLTKSTTSSTKHCMNSKTKAINKNRNARRCSSSEDASTANLMAVIQYFLKDYTSSERYFQTASKIDPKCDIIMNNYAVLLLEQGRLEDAEEQIISAIQCNPQCIKNHQQYAFILYSMGKYELAAKECQLMIVLQPNIESYSGYAWLLEQMGKFEESVVQYEELIQLEPDNAIWYYWHAVLLQRCDTHGLSADNFNQCLQIDPHYEGANGNYAYSLYLQEEYEMAHKHICIALSNESDAHHSCVHYYYALILIQANNIQTAVNELHLCLELIQERTNMCKNEKGCLGIDTQDIYHLLHQIGY